MRWEHISTIFFQECMIYNNPTTNLNHILSLVHFDQQSTTWEVESYCPIFQGFSRSKPGNISRCEPTRDHTGLFRRCLIQFLFSKKLKN